jgi:uncharacterized protein YdeI (YjbR/CyaY-like superfamily)
MTPMNPKVDWFFNKADAWHDEYAKLRVIALECGLYEELKWGCPCYTYQHDKIILIHGFKNYCAYLFFKGSLLSDPDGILVQQTRNVQVPRQMRFTSAGEIVRMKAIIKAYIHEAIELAQLGVKPKMKKTSEFEMPEEFQVKLEKSAALKKAFEGLTPGRQRGYLLYFSSAKQSKTREARVEKYSKQILKGKGLDD